MTHNNTFCIVLQGLNELNYTKYLEQYIVAQSCLTLWDSIDCTVPSFSVYGDVPGKNTGVGFHALLQGIFPTQGSNPGLPYCRQILYRLSHQGNPRILEWVAYPFSRGSPNPRTKPLSSASPGLQANSLLLKSSGKPYSNYPNQKYL